MRHVGDISQLKGYELEPVDVITGGSPCQDLSVAGKRAGMKQTCGQCGKEFDIKEDIDACPDCGAEITKTRSGLFIEQVRIIKEMRKADEARGRTADAIRPRYMVWENVPGAFSSNGGEDFRAVLEETIRIVEPEAPDIHVPDRGGWPTSGCFQDMDGRWSVAWRVLDAQFWGVPQRRRRIALVADFGGRTAAEILFIRAGLSGDYPESGETRQGTAGAAESGVNSTEYLTPWESQRRRIFGDGGICPTMDGSDGGGGRNPGGLVAAGFNGYKSPRADIQYQEETAAPLERNMPGNVAYGFKAGQGAQAGGLGYQEELSPTITASPSGTNQVPAICLQGSMIGREDKNGPQGDGINEEVSFTLNTTDRHAVFDARGNGNGNIAPTLTGDHQNRITDYTAIALDKAAYNAGKGSNRDMGIDAETDTAFTITGRQPGVVAELQNEPRAIHQNQCGELRLGSVANTLNTNGNASGRNAPIVMAHGQANAEIVEDMSPTLNCNHEQPICYTEQMEDEPGEVRAIRRLTPMECERLQGYADGWTDIPGIEKPTAEEIAFWRNVFKRHEEINRPPKHGEVKGRSDAAIIRWLKNPTSDTARYKALGNSIALPPWKWILKRIAAFYERDATLGSLFDGIGGFPLIWEQINGRGTARWASEIEPFCIAVTKYRFCEEV